MVTTNCDQQLSIYYVKIKISNAPKLRNKLALIFGLSMQVYANEKSSKFSAREWEGHFRIPFKIRISSYLLLILPANRPRFCAANPTAVFTYGVDYLQEEVTSCQRVNLLLAPHSQLFQTLPPPSPLSQQIVHHHHTHPSFRKAPLNSLVRTSVYPPVILSVAGSP